MLKHYVGVYDPKTGELQLVEAHELVIRGVARSAATQTESNGIKKQQTVCDSTEVPHSQGYTNVL